MDTKNKKTTNLERYVDPMGEVSNKDLKLGVWYVQNKILINKIGLFSLGAVSVTLFLYGIGGLLFYLFFGISSDARIAEGLVKQNINFSAMRNTYAPKELGVNNSGVYQSSPGKADFVAEINNPNTRHLAIITYAFEFDGAATEETQAVILPSVTRPVAIIGAEAQNLPTSARFVLKNIDWQRIDPAQIFEVQKYQEERMKFEVSNFSFTAMSSIANIPSNIIGFEVTNKSAYSYWEVPLIIELMNGDNRVGITTARVDEFESNEKATIDVRSLAPNLFVTGIRIYPAMNIFDKRSYIAPEA